MLLKPPRSQLPKPSVSLYLREVLRIASASAPIDLSVASQEAITSAWEDAEYVYPEDWHAESLSDISDNASQSLASLRDRCQPTSQVLALLCALLRSAGKEGNNKTLTVGPVLLSGTSLDTLLPVTFEVYMDVSWRVGSYSYSAADVSDVLSILAERPQNADSLVEQLKKIFAEKPLDSSDDLMPEVSVHHCDVMVIESSCLLNSEPYQPTSMAMSVPAHRLDTFKWKVDVLLSLAAEDASTLDQNQDTDADLDELTDELDESTSSAIDDFMDEVDLAPPPAPVSFTQVVSPDVDPDLRKFARVPTTFKKEDK